jgi:lysophospholipase L1-like esterase
LAEQTNTRWVGTWTTSPAPLEGVALGGQTVRMITRVSIGGGTVRVRLSNAYGNRPLPIGAAHIAIRAKGAEIVPGSDRALTFNGGSSAEIATGALLVSDPVALDVPPLADLAVSLHLPGDVPEDFQITGNNTARVTNYISETGDHAAAASFPAAQTTGNWIFVSGVDVMAPAGTGGIVALGDSLTIGNISEIDGNNRFTDQLARRLAARKGGRALGVMNQGIGGNRLIHDARGGSGLRRFDRDVLAQPGVTHCIVLLGTNDLRNRSLKPEEDVTADEMIAGLNQLAIRAHTCDIKIFGGTVLTFENENFNPPPGLPGLYTPERDKTRQAINDWIRETDAFDGVIDFETALRDPDHPTRMLPKYDCGDHLHPSDAGYLHMGDIIDLAPFD